MSSSSPPAARAHPRPRAHYAWLWCALLALSAAWSALTPLGGAADEPNHVINAASVVRGQLQDPLPGYEDHPTTRDWKVVELPEAYRYVQLLPNCFAYEPDVPASCQDPLPEGADRPTALVSSAGRYNPTYYAMVGLPTLLPDTTLALYLMRLLSSLWCATFLVAGVRALDRLPAPRALRAGLLVALTPGALYLMSTINPNGLEVAVAVSLWACLIALTCAPGADPARPASPPAGAGGLLIQAGISAALLSTLRPITPVWALAVVALGLALAGRPRLTALLRHRAALAVAALGLITVAWVLGWMLTRPSPVEDGVAQLPEVDELGGALVVLAEHADDLYLQAVGNFGWLDNPSPDVTLALWTVVAAMTLVLGWALGARHRGDRWPGAPAGTLLLAPPWRTVLLLTALVWAVVPLVMTLPYLEAYGILWQGRYTYALQVGAGLLLGLGLSSAASHDAPLAPRATAVVLARVLPWLAVAVVVLHAAALWSAALRWGVGLGAGLVPPARYAVPALLGSLALAAVVALLVAPPRSARAPGAVTAPGGADREPRAARR